MRVKIIFLTSLILLTLVIVFYAFELSPKKYLKISFLDVGQGDSILIQTPRGGKILIDGGRDKKVLSEIGKELSIFSKEIELVVATHDDADHVTGLIDVLQRFKVSVLLYSLPNSSSELSRQLLQIAKEKNVRIVHITKPMIIKSADGLIVKVLFPVKNMDQENSSDIFDKNSEVLGNDASIVTQIIFGENKFLLTGDLPHTGEKYLINKYGDSLKSNILKFGHHGSDSSSSPEFLSVVSPNIGIVSAGKDNTFGHPHRSVLELAEKFGITVLQTDMLGTINIYSNGINIWRD